MKLTYLWIFLLLLTACEDVIELPLNRAEERYVIEAVLTNQRGGAKVILSKTTGFNESNTLNGVANADVQISDMEGGTTTQLRAGATTGVYTHPELRSMSNRSYTLTVKVGGKTFKSTVKAPPRGVLNEVFGLDVVMFDGLRHFSHVTYSDPAGVKNYYRFVERVNGVYTKRVNVVNDEFTDGRVVTQIIYPYTFTAETKLKKGDAVVVDMLCIAEEVYKYLNSIQNGATGQSGSASPANPVTNISGGALGYFSVHSVQTGRYKVE